MTIAEPPASQRERPARRPWSVVAAVGLFATWWGVSAGVLGFSVPAGQLGGDDIAAIAGLGPTPPGLLPTVNP